MQSGTTVPHGMGYPLTHFKNVTHGIASAITLPAFLDSLKNKESVQHVVNKCGFKSLEDFSVFIKTIVRLNVSITVTEAEISKWSEEFMKLSNRLEQHPETVSKDIIEEIYRQSLVDYIVP